MNLLYTISIDLVNKFSRTLFFLLFILLLIGYSTPTLAQKPATTQRDYIGNHMFWGNMIILGKIKGKFYYQLDLEYRRQADPNHPVDPNTTIGSNHYNIFKHPYQDAVRPWIHYMLNKNIRLSWSPITWFGTWSAPVNGVTVFQPEYRTSPQITFNQTIGRVMLNYRYRYEFRFYGTKKVAENTGDVTGPSSSYSFLDINKQGRFRVMLRAIVPLNKKVLEKGTYYLMTSGELFIKTGKNIKNANIYDQSRFYLGLGWKFAPEIRVEMGYLNQTAFRFNNIAKNNIDFNNSLFFNLIFDDFNSLFKKKKEAVKEQ
jgi:hypothetical protein